MSEAREVVACGNIIVELWSTRIDFESLKADEQLALATPVMLTPLLGLNERVVARNRI